MPLAFLIPVFSFAACPLIILFQRWLPLRGAPLAILAIGGGFVVWAVDGGELPERVRSRPGLRGQAG